jgi:hypothetical protein
MRHAVVLLGLAGALLAGGCSDDDSGGNETTDARDEAPGADADGDAADGDAPEDAPGADADGDADDAGEDDGREPCPRTPDPPLSETRMRHIVMTAPTAMTSALFEGLLNDLLEAESFVWLTRIEGFGTGTLSATSGSGHKVEGEACAYTFFEEEWPPAEVLLTETGLDFELAGDPIPRVDVALWARGTTYPEPVLTVLPLRELRIQGTFSADHLWIGSWDPDSETWTDGGSLSAKITVADAMETPIISLGITLCGLLSGDTGDPRTLDDDCTRPRPWTNEPDTTVDGEEAYSMAGTYAGSTIDIVP